MKTTNHLTLNHYSFKFKRKAKHYNKKVKYIIK